MATVQTVKGEIDASQLGNVLMHEHIFSMNPELEINYPNPAWDEEKYIRKARETFVALKALGIDTVVDVTVMGLGRDVRRIARVAQDLDFNIVVATGYYTYFDLPGYFRTHGPGLRIDMDDPLKSMFVTDIVEGIAGTGIKAAIIKLASDKHGFTPDVERVFRAGVHAHKETGAPITTHSVPKLRGGLEQQAFLKSEGVDLTKVVIGHCGDTTDIDYLKEVLDQGSVIGMDRFGMESLPSDLPVADRIGTIVTLCEMGYAEQMVLSHDANVFSLTNEPHNRDRLLPNLRYSYVPGEILPALRERGVTDRQIQQMMMATPARILSRS